MTERFGDDRYGDIKQLTYVCKLQSGRSGFRRVDFGPYNYADKMDRIGISHGSSKQMAEALTEEDQSIFLRSELCKLMCVSRIARPGAIYAASGVSRTFTDRK